MESKVFKKKVEKLWKSTRKDLSKFLKDAERLVKKGEVYIKDKSEKGKKELEIITLTVQRERLSYELGKTVAKHPNSKDGYSKKALNLLNKIKGINRKIKRLKVS